MVAWVGMGPPLASKSVVRAKVREPDHLTAPTTSRTELPAISRAPLTFDYLLVDAILVAPTFANAAFDQIARPAADAAVNMGDGVLGKQTPTSTTARNT